MLRSLAICTDPVRVVVVEGSNLSEFDFHRFTIKPNPMDPNLFHIDYERLFEVIVAIGVLAILVERGLSMIFESRPFINATETKHGIRELITIVVCVGVCVYWKFDAFTILIVNSDKMSVVGMVLTGTIVAGGSKGSIKLFRDMMGWISSAEKERVEKRDLLAKRKLEKI